MTFQEVLAQVIDWLKRERRVSYRALKRQFDLDDDFMEDLKDALLFAHPVVDEDGRGLVWTGELDATPAVASCTSPIRTTHPRRRTPPAHRDVL
jgi:hypothetical protein